MSHLCEILALSEKKRRRQAAMSAPILREIHNNPIMLFKYSVNYLVNELGISPELCCILGQQALRGGKQEAIKHIQKCWRECYYNPAYKVCKNRLSREFNDLTQP